MARILCLPDYSKKSLGILEKFVMKQLLEQWSHPEFSSIKGFQKNLLSSRYNAGAVDCDDWTEFTKPSWIDSIIEGARSPKTWIQLGPGSLLKGVREIPTILLMYWAFDNGLMEFGVFKTRG